MSCGFLILNITSFLWHPKFNQEVDLNLHKKEIFLLLYFHRDVPEWFFQFHQATIFFSEERFHFQFHFQNAFLNYLFAERCKERFWNMLQELLFVQNNLKIDPTSNLVKISLFIVVDTQILQIFSWTIFSNLNFN